MKKIIIGFTLFVATGLFSCKKDSSVSTDAATAAIQQAVAQEQAIAVAKSTTTAGDSVYVVNVCSRNSREVAIDFSALPSGVTDYLDTSYSGYTALKAFVTKDSTGTINGYVAIIQYNGNPIGIKFDGNGNFVKVLEQREGHDLLGIGWHRGGCFDNRDGLHRNMIAISSLPSAVQSYFTANYPQDTLTYAFIKRDGNYVVISKNNSLFATEFTSTGTFVSRIQLPARHGWFTSIDVSALPATAATYLTTSYPGYVFEKAFSITGNNIIVGYTVVIDSNNTKYGLLFDASGNFIAVKVLP